MVDVHCTGEAGCPMEVRVALVEQGHIAAETRAAEDRAEWHTIVQQIFLRLNADKDDKERQYRTLMLTIIAGVIIGVIVHLLTKGTP